jgi:hypothetical protein
MPPELNEKLVKLNELLNSSVSNLRSNKQLEKSKLEKKATSVRDLNTNKLTISRLDRKPSPVKGQISERPIASSFIYRKERVRSPLINSVSLSSVYPPTNPQ